MANELILSIDCGTQSVRALLFDSEGTLRAKEQIKFEPYFSSFPGWAEQDPELYWQSACCACKQLKENNPDLWGSIIGVAVTTQRDTCVAVDQNMHALRPAILWLDQRMAKCEKPLPMQQRLLFSAVGMTKTLEITRKKGKANWIRENEPEILEKTYKFLLLSGYFVMKLSGRFVDSVASQIGHVPFDSKRRCWAKPSDFKWNLFDIEPERLPELVEPGTVIGGVTKEAAEQSGILEGTALIAAGSDKGCETLGMGCLSDGDASLSYGTTATVQTTSAHYFEPLQFMPAYPASIPGYYNPEIEIFRGYWMISRFVEEYAQEEAEMAKQRHMKVEALLDEELDKVPAGCRGLMLTPYWGPGLKMPDAKGSIIGFGEVHTKPYIYRSIIEGINYMLLEGMESLEKRSGSGKKIKRVMVSGGGSASDVVCQITADMFDRPTYKGVTSEASGLGAAINGFVGLGVYSNYEVAVSKMVHYAKVFTPDSENAQLYHKLHSRVYKHIYPKLRELYREIQSITDYPKF